MTRVTRAHEDLDVVRVEREGDEEGPVAEVVESRQTRSSVSHRNKGTKVAALPASQDAADDEPAADDTLDSQEADELLSEAEELLHEPLQGGKTKSSTKRHTEAGPSRLAAGSNAARADVVPDTQHQIEEVPADTASQDAQDEPHIEEPESSIPAALDTAAGLLSKITVARMCSGFLQHVQIACSSSSQIALDICS